MNHENELIKAVINALRGNAQIVALIGEYYSAPAIFTHVPQDYDTSAPYITLFNIESNAFDNDATLGFDGTLTIHTWCETRDIAKVNEIKNEIYNTLHNAELVYTDIAGVTIDQEFTTTLRDPDGITFHGVQRFRFIMQQSEG